MELVTTPHVGWFKKWKPAESDSITTGKQAEFRLGEHQTRILEICVCWPTVVAIVICVRFLQIWRIYSLYDIIVELVDQKKQVGKFQNDGNLYKKNVDE